MTRPARVLLGVFLFITGAAAPAAAHRLDEYLQATRIGIERDRLQVDISLTPGANISAHIASIIDTDANGVFSEGERAEYVARVLRSTTVTIDGRRLALAVDGREFPSNDTMAAGVGTIRIQASAALPWGLGRRHLAYSNGHLPEMSVYLVNPLVPSDPSVILGPPQRDSVQRALDLDFEVAADVPAMRTAWVLVASALLTTLAATRRRYHPAR